MTSGVGQQGVYLRANGRYALLASDCRSIQVLDESDRVYEETKALDLFQLIFRK